MEKKRKLTRIRKLIGVGGISLKGLHDLLGKIRSASEADDGLLESVGYRAIKDANNEYFREVACTIELDLLGGGTFKWELCDPGRLLAFMIESSPQLMEVWAELANSREINCDNPLSLIVAFDEYTPGSKLP